MTAVARPGLMPGSEPAHARPHPVPAEPDHPAVALCAGRDPARQLAPQIDKARDGGSANIDTARDVLIATATGMIAFTGFVLSGVLLVVQFAAGSYSPRLVLWFRRDHLIKHAIGIFLAAFVFALVALRRLDEPGRTSRRTSPSASRSSC